MSSGVGVHDDCINLFQELKLKKKYKYIIFGVSTDKTQVVVEKTSDAKDYSDFVADLPEKECKWAVYDFEFEKEGGAGVRNKIAFVSWSPDEAPVKSKMLFASSKDALRKALVGIAVEVQGTDFSEVEYDAVLEKAKKGN